MPLIKSYRVSLYVDEAQIVLEGEDGDPLAFLSFKPGAEADDLEASPDGAHHMALPLERFEGVLELLRSEKPLDFGVVPDNRGRISTRRELVGEAEEQGSCAE